MPTVIDSLVIALGLDPKGQFKRDSDRALDVSKKTKEQLARDAKANAESQKQFKQAVKDTTDAVVSLGVLMTAGTGIKAFVQAQILGAASAGRLAHNLDLSVESLTAWEGVVKQVGGTSADADQSLQSLVSTAQEMKLMGSSSKVPFLQALGLSTQDLQDPSEFLLKVADRFQKIDPALAQTYGAGLGLTPSMINLLEQGRAKTKAMLDAQREHAAVTAEEARQAQEFQKQTEYLTASLAKLMREVIMPMLPGLTQMATGFANAAQEYPGMVKGLFGIAAALTAISAVRLPLSILRLLGIGGGAEGAAGLAGVGGVGSLGLAAPLAMILGAPLVVASQRGALANLAGNLSGLSDKDLGDAAAFAKKNLAAVPAGAAGETVKAHWARRIAEIGAEIARRQGAGGSAAPTGSQSDGSSSIPSGGDSRNGWVLKLLQGAGYSAAQAEGFRRVLNAEGGSLTASNSAGGGLGAHFIAQWRGARLRALVKQYGANPTRDQQGAFILSELATTEKGAAAALKQAKTWQDAARIVAERYERPGPGLAGDLRRSGVSGAPSVTIGTVTVQTSASTMSGTGADLAAALKKYDYASQAQSGPL